MNIVQKVQIKFNQNIYKYKRHFSLPVYNFIRQMTYGILLSKHVHLNKIGSVLDEEVSLKKTTERLSRNLRRAELGRELLNVHLQTNSYAIKQCKYLIFDLSDISKTYARKMEGMERVHDGSSDGTGYGYWLSNIIATDKNGSTIIPVYSELYALKHESETEHSENAKIIKACETVEAQIGLNHINVYDRGGDRRVLIENHLATKRHFIIRQTGRRNLIYQNKTLSLKELSRKVVLDHDFQVSKTRNGKTRNYTYHCGAMQVYFPKENNQAWENPLWLVVAKRDNRGYVWYLSHLPVLTVEEAVKTTMEGYGNRWKIEEVHRHIKDEYSLEEILLGNYIALKNFMVLFWLTMSLIYKDFESMSIEIIQRSGIKLTYRDRLSEYYGFIYYKIAKAVSWLLSKTTLETKSPFARDPGIGALQLCFDFG